MDERINSGGSSLIAGLRRVQCARIGKRFERPSERRHMGQPREYVWAVAGVCDEGGNVVMVTLPRPIGATRWGLLEGHRSILRPRPGRPSKSVFTGLIEAEYAFAGRAIFNSAPTQLFEIGSDLLFSSVSENARVALNSDQPRQPKLPVGQAFRVEVYHFSSPASAFDSAINRGIRTSRAVREMMFSIMLRAPLRFRAKPDPACGASRPAACGPISNEK